VSTLNGQWLDVFRAGDYGDKGNYSIANLAQMCANYDASKDEVPFVLGHPSNDGPAYAWTKALRMQGDLVQALAGEVDPAFDTAVKAGRYKKRSVAFKQHPDGSLKMPLELRHIGYLGAMLPAVKGLRDAKFGDDRFSEIEFSENPKGDVMDEKSILNAIKAFFAETFGSSNPAPTGGLTQVQIDAAIERATAKFTEELKAEREARVAAEARFSEFQTQVSATNGNARAATLIFDLKEKKHWLPAFDEMGVPALFTALTAEHPIEITFGEGDKQQKVDAAQMLANVLHGLGKIVPEGALFASGGTVETPKSTPSGNGTPVDPGSALFHEQVVTRSKEKNIPYNDALKQLNAEGKSSATYGGASTGAV